MKRFLKMAQCGSAALLLSGGVLVSGAQAGPFAFLKPTPTTSPYSPQTQAPPLAAPLPAGTAVQQVSSSSPKPLPAAATAPAAAPAAAPVEEVQPVVAITSQEPRVCLVNTKHVKLSYLVTDLGPSGLAGVEVWYTHEGKLWQKFDGVQRENPLWVDLEEGIYGITLVARTGFDGGKAPPVEGEAPQFWVQVDLTKPVVFLSSVNLANGTHTLNLTWTARDENLSRKPINLYYAEDTRGPWLPIASGLENTGTYSWQIPPSTPSSFLVRVEATDKAGNIGTSDTPTPIRIDLAQPKVSDIRLSTDAK